MGAEYNPYIKQYVDTETHSVVDPQQNQPKPAQPEQPKPVQPEQPAPASTSDNTPKGGGGGNKPASQDSYYIRDGQRINTKFVDGHNVNADGTPIEWRPGDISVTPGGQFWEFDQNGVAKQVTGDDTQGMIRVMNAVGASDNYAPKGNYNQIYAQQSFESWLQQDPALWNQYLQIGFKWNEAKARGDEAGMAAAHKEMEALRQQYGHIGKTDGTLTTVTDPNLIPPELLDEFGPLIDLFNASLTAEIGNLGTSSFPTYMAPEIGESPNVQLALTKIAQYPELVQAVIKNAPNSVLAYKLQAEFPEYRVGEGIDPMQNLGYELQYMNDYWNRFQNEYDPEKYASDYDAIRDQLIAANQAGVDLGRMQLEAQLQNALPQYDELRAQSDLAKNKAANNMALYNQAQGDLGGIGSRRYSTEQNAYDQRMNEIQLEQQNLINTTNQQIAQLEAEGKMKEAQLLAEWGQAKLEAMQEQYNIYWNLYQQGASSMENMAYGIASDEWNRDWQIREDELKQQYQKYLADVDKYNADVDLAKTQLDVDRLNRDYEFDKWKADTDIALQQAQEENTYNANKRADEVKQQAMQLDVDQLNRDYDYTRWLNDTNLAISEADKQYEREWKELEYTEQLRERAFEEAMSKLEHGMLSDADIQALGVPAEQAKAIADQINILSQLDIDTARAQLDHLKTQTSLLGASRSGGSGGGGSRSGGGGGGDDSGSGDIFDQLFASGVDPIRAYAKLLEMGYGVTAAKQLSDAYSALYPDLQTAAGINPETGMPFNIPYNGNANGAVATALDMLGHYDGNAGDGSPSLETLLWGLNHDPTMQNILDDKGAPYASYPNKKDKNADGTGGVNYIEKK